VVPGVKITVTNTATNVATGTTSDKSGFYQALNLPIGTYKIVAATRVFAVGSDHRSAGDQPVVSGRPEAGSGRGQRTGVGGIAGCGVETVNPTLGESVTSRPIVNMPLNGRNVLDLALLQPGVTRTIRTIRARVMARARASASAVDVRIR